MSKGITLSKKHGVNPSMDICFWCGEPKGLALFGRMKGDAEAPKRMVTSLEPCDKCKEKFMLGVHLIEVTDDGSRFGDNKAFAFGDTEGKPHWPTGRYVVMKPEAMKDGKPGTKALCDKATMDRILASAKNGAPEKK